MFYYISENMQISKQDLVAIDAIYHEKNWGAIRICKFFANKSRSIQSINRVLQRIRQTGVADKQIGSGKRPTVNTPENSLIVSPVGSSRKHLSPRMIIRRTGISHSSVRKIVKLLNLKVFKRQCVQKLTDAQKERRKVCCQNLLDRFPIRQV
ncbi:uncharacterized protein LOC136085626 [Hydra vulgaris]|uniref:Uncharacterized protein LOC136085626 n=1 Tax=Hydra vulgaris TaxID=6087 RepID=A0ABM4CMI2_HYDVU